MAVGYLETGVVYCDDNLHRLSQFPAECTDLIYLDPPFFSNRHYEVIWGDEAEVRSFEDRWDGGMQVYVQWMKERVIEMHRILKPTGTLFLHCDWHASHYLKVMLDEVFGPKNMRNEIIWCYRGGGVPKTAFARKHDTIFFYSKGNEWTFHPQYVPYSASTQEVTGRTGQRVNKTEIDLERGAHMPDWWVDINSLQTWQQERLGWPTQKPEALLERIIVSTTDPDDIVLDPFCGCGTAITVAEKQHRQWIGIDISPTAVGLMKRRVEKAGARNVKLVGMPVTPSQLRELKPFEFQNWVIQRFNGTHSTRKSGDMGIDGHSFMTHDPIQVKRSDNVGRNVVDNFETAMEREGRTTGYIVAFSFTKGAKEEVARVRAAKGLDIKLVTVEAMLLDTANLVTPTSSDTLFDPSADDAPLPTRRASEDRPSSEQLVESARAEE